MPVRSLSSSVLKWPDRAAVHAAARQWAGAEAAKRPDLVGLGVFGSYARGDAGVGSDLDLVAIVRQATHPPGRRAAEWDLTGLPVAADLLVYTEAEWRALRAAGTRFARTLAREVLWLVGPGV